MTVGIWVLGDQLSHGQAALLQRSRFKGTTPVILIESVDYVADRPYHYQKLVLVWSAMRHFAAELKAAGWDVHYAIASNFQSPLTDWIQEKNISELLIMQPTDRPFEQLIKHLVFNSSTNYAINCAVTFVTNNHFLWSRDDFYTWAKDRKKLILEDFYRAGRKRFDVLMDQGKPLGDRWNFDKENRQPPKQNIQAPSPQWFMPDSITQDVIQRIKDLKSTGKIQGYGQLEPFRWAVTRSQALTVFTHFLNSGLEKFGTFQDAMVVGEETLWHSLISPYLNLGLLHPWEVIEAVAELYSQQTISLNNIEGFIRQILGWREYLHGIYHYVSPDYATQNYFDHQHPLPEFYWDSSKTDFNCLQQTLQQVEKTGYAHHIQRLMVLSNFALISGVNPQSLEQWFHAAFIDGYDWVMQTNVMGMGQFADGGILASKPYAASANYIHKMSNYCSGCRYNRGDRHGELACPFNTFYWHFLDRHQDKLRQQGRMHLILKSLDRMDDGELAKIRYRAEQWHQQIFHPTSSVS